MLMIFECVKNNDCSLLKENLKNILNEDLNLKDHDGYTAAMWAAFKGYDKCLKILIDSGCDLNLKDNFGYTAAMFAVYNGHDKYLQMLIDAGCDLNLKTNLDNTVTILAAYWRYDKCLKMLIDTGCDLHVQNKKGYTTLHFICQKNLIDSLIFLLN